MFSRLLIANRGEIACRVIRTARDMGIRTIAVYSDADTGARHVDMADEAYRIGPALAADSYLSVERILAVARESGAEAIHPGYGFLSENAEFAEACAAAGIVFVGPSPAAIRAMGSKIEAKTLAQEAGVPVVPGYNGLSQGRGELKAAADEIGYPVMIKASAGGGGRGMRMVREASLFDDALDSASREAKAAFGDGRVLIEKFIARPRHIEVQVFGDTHGNIVHLFERDCSVQRRHQKIVEEAPAPGLSDTLRKAMGEAAIEVARRVDYMGAGTVEFIVDRDKIADDDGFFFLEMNTRLQVEHPVTEMITGIDLVAWQLDVAAGGVLPKTQADIHVNGHAVEVRLYAEDHRRDFLPSTGCLDHLRFPGEGSSVRVDTGVREGDTVTRHYDPMIAKMIASGGTRATALSTLEQGLKQTEVIGPATNLAFLTGLLGYPAFQEGDVDTTFVHLHRAALLAASEVSEIDALILSGVYATLAVKDGDDLVATDPYSPWRRRDGWRGFGRAPVLHQFRDGETDAIVSVEWDGDALLLGLPDDTYRVSGKVTDGGTVRAILGRRTIKGRVIERGLERHVLIDGRARTLVLSDPDAPSTQGEASGGKLTAPLPAAVVQVHVEAGATVARGMPLMVLEAMKMEHVITAPSDGVVAAVHFAVGQQVDEGAELVVLNASDGGSDGGAE
jgi:3-methylcrotonyl-CoA carboxylase alpha subunit